MLKELLESSGKLQVTVTNHPEKMTKETLDGVDLILSKWNAYGKDVKEWPESAKTAFIDYMNNGAGFVVVHAGVTCFHNWKSSSRL